MQRRSSRGLTAVWPAQHFRAPKAGDLSHRREPVGQQEALVGAWWQGRSEVRRDNAVRGIAKELERVFRGTPAPARGAVVLLFGSALAAGAPFELVARRAPRRESRGG